MIRAAIQGEAGSFSHAAARQVFGSEVPIHPCVSFDELFAAVVEGSATHGVVPVENTLAGSVPGNLDRLMASGLHAVAETAVRVELCLITPPGVALAAVRCAASHPVALEQCRGFFRDHTGVVAETVYDTAGAVRQLMGGETSFDAAIASSLSAELYGGAVLIEGIEDNPQNFTRFFAIAPQPGGSCDGDLRASIAFVIPHEPGSLHRALGHFAEAALNLTRLESRPIPGRPWEYRFHADLRGSADRLTEAFERLASEAGELHVLGRYPAVMPYGLTPP